MWNDIVCVFQFQRSYVSNTQLNCKELFECPTVQELQKFRTHYENL